MSAPLLYYNPNVATRHDNFHLPGIERFSKFFKLFNPNVVFLDRTRTIRIPIRTESIFPMPAFQKMCTSFEDLCDRRARELLNRARELASPIHVMWSGGIDSTLLLISFLKSASAEEKANIVVLLTEESISENPNFYRDHIRGKLRVDSSSMFTYLLGTKHFVVGGEHNDQLFGSDMVGKLIVQFGPKSIHAPYSRDTFFSFFNPSIGDSATTNFYLDMFERLQSTAPIPVLSNFDFLWWINFSLKWQSVFMRMLTYTAKRNTQNVTREYIKSRYVHFYGTEDFQLWSMNNMDKKIKDAWNTYKWPCKDIIYDYTKDADYRDNKVKRGSLYFLLLQRSSFNFIDADMNFHHELPATEYYNPDNDFV